MRINPVFLKDLKLNVRNIKFAMIIFTYNICLGLIIILFMYMSMHRITGQFVFNYVDCDMLYSILSGVELGSILFIVPALTTGAVAGEREKQTLNLLLVSKLSPFHIICGKMSFAVTAVFIIIISNFPLSAIVAVTGSISIRVQSQLLILLFVTVLYVASIGMFFSTLKRSTVAAALWTYGVLVLITVGTILLYNLNGYVLEDIKLYNQNERNVVYYLFLLNPIATYVYMVSPDYSVISSWIPTYMQHNWVELSVFLQLGVSLLLLGIASIKLNPQSLNVKLRLWNRGSFLAVRGKK